MRILATRAEGLRNLRDWRYWALCAAGTLTGIALHEHRHAIATIWGHLWAS